MMKRIPLLLVLLLMLVLPAALAEESTPYVPGDCTKNLVLDAFDRGDMLTLDMAFDLALSENAEAIFGEDAALLSACAELLEHAQLSVGAGKIEDGLRVTLAGDYTVDARSASLNAALDLTAEGVLLTGSFLPGECLTAKWETLLSLAGATEEDIASIMSLRDADAKALLAELIAQVQPMLDMAAQIAAPYGETIMAHIAALPMVVNENVPAEYGYPAAAAEVQIQITAKAVGDLIVALCEQLKQDATLCAMIDMLLAESGTPDMNTVQLCDAMIAAAKDDLTDETMPLNLFIGMDAAGNLLYLNIIDENDDGTYFTINYIAGQLEETGASLINLDILTLTGEQEIIDGVSLVTAYGADGENPNIMSTEVRLGGYAAGEEILSFTLYLDNAAADYEGQSGYAGMLTMALAALDGEAVAGMNMDASIASFPAADGGEEISVSGSMTVSAEAEEIPMTFETAVKTAASEGSPAIVMTEAIKAPELGVAEWCETYTLHIAAQEPDAALTATALETASPEALEAMAGRATTSLEQTLTTLFELLPPELLESAESGEEPASPALK